MLSLDAPVSSVSDAASTVAAAPVPAPAPALLSTVVLFTGASALRWRSSLQIGHEYLLTRLRISTVFQDKPEHAQRVFVTTAAPKTTAQPPAAAAAPTQALDPDHAFDSTAKQTLVIHIRGPASPTEPSDSDPLSTAPSAQLPLHPGAAASAAATAAASVAVPCFPPPTPLPSSITYTGTVTAQPIWGVFELDGDASLLLP